MRKYKKTVEVGGRIFNIRMYKKMPKDTFEELGNCGGWCDWENSELGLIEDQCKKDDLVLFHEIGHAAADATRANNPLLNETFARPFFAIFYAALRNVGLIK